MIFHEESDKDKGDSNWKRKPKITELGKIFWLDNNCAVDNFFLLECVPINIGREPNVRVPEPG